MFKILPKQKKRYNIIKDYHDTFKCETGEKVIRDLMKQSYFLSPTHDYRDPVASHKNEGKRELFLYILNRLEMNPDQILQIIKEQDEELSGEGEDYV